MKKDIDLDLISVIEFWAVGAGEAFRKENNWMSR